VKNLPYASNLEPVLGNKSYNQKFIGLSQQELENWMERFGEFVDIDSISVEEVAPWKDAFWLRQA
jgi:hypothetical protein